MLMMRRHEKDFMLRRDPKYGDDLAKRANEFSKAVAANPLMSPADRTDITSKLSDYERNFSAWMEAANGARPRAECDAKGVHRDRAGDRGDDQAGGGELQRHVGR